MVKKTKKKSKNLRRTRNKRNKRNKRRINNKTIKLRGGAKLVVTKSSKKAYQHQWEERDKYFPYSGQLSDEKYSKQVSIRVLYLIIDTRNLFPKGSDRSEWPPKGESGDLRNFLLADYYGKGKNIYQHMRESDFNKLSLIICDFEDFSKSGMGPQDFKDYIKREIELLEGVNAVPPKGFRIDLEYTYLVGLSNPIEDHTNKDIIEQQRQIEFAGPDYSSRKWNHGRLVGECTWVRSIAGGDDWDHEFCGLDDHLAILAQKKIQRDGGKSVLLSSDNKIYQTSNEALLKYYTKSSDYYEFYNSLPVYVVTDNNNLGLDIGSYSSTFGEILHSMGGEYILGSARSGRFSPPRSINFSEVQEASKAFRKRNVINIVIGRERIGIKFRKLSKPPQISSISNEDLKTKLEKGNLLIGINGIFIRTEIPFEEVIRMINESTRPLTLQFLRRGRVDIKPPPPQKKTTVAAGAAGAATAAAGAGSVVMGPGPALAAVMGTTLPTTQAAVATALTGLATSPVTVPVVAAGVGGALLGILFKKGITNISELYTSMAAKNTLRSEIVRDVQQLIHSWNTNREFTQEDHLLLKDLKALANSLELKDFSMTVKNKTNIRDYLEFHILLGSARPPYNLYNYVIPVTSTMSSDPTLQSVMERRTLERGTTRKRELEQPLLNTGGFVPSAAELVKSRSRRKVSYEDVGKKYIGSKINKMLDGQIYEGEVKSWDDDAHFYKIKYDDGDEEEMTVEEVEDHLV